MDNIKSKLVDVKSQLVQIIADHPYPQYDGEQLEYLVQLLDWMILDQLKVDCEAITTLMEEIVSTSVHQLNLDLLDTLHTLSQIQKELYGSKI